MTVHAIGRRAALGLAGGAALAAAGTHPAAAQQARLTAVMPGPFLPDGARAILERQINARVENLPYVSPTDTAAKLMAPGGTGRYDLMYSTTGFIQAPVLRERAGQELARPLDLAKIPNAAKISPLFQSEITRRGNNTFMLPVVWGYDSVVYNRDRIPEADAVTQSWGVLFDDRYAGRVALRDDPYQSICLTALHLGIRSPETMSQADLNRVTQFLISKKRNFRTIWGSFAEAVNLMSSREVDAVFGWIPMRAALQRQGMNVTNNWPSEGLLVFTHSAFIPRESRNADLAHAAINAALSDEFGKQLGQETQYPVTNGNVAASFSEADQARLGYDVEKRGIPLHRYAFPAAMDRWIEAWGRFKAA
jgi:spermidine/putrescine-binding protein